MTEKRALELSIEMWEELKKLNKEKPWLSITSLKTSYFNNILKNNPKYIEPLSCCYLCEYSIDKAINNALGNLLFFKCAYCPVKNWSIDKKYGAISRKCFNYDSVYHIGTTKEIINNVLELLKETYNDLYNK